MKNFINLSDFFVKFIVLFMLAFSALSQVLELEETSLKGKKDQPSAMLFVSKAQMEIINPVYKYEPNNYKLIEKQTLDDIFEIRVNNSFNNLILF